MRDLIVIGAGPGGSVTAKEAAKRGLDVLLIDRKDEIGSPKRCAEGLGLGTFERHDIPIKDKFKAKDIYGARIYAPNGNDVEVRSEEVNGFVLERKVFDKYLAKMAAEEGAEVRAGVEATNLEKTEEDTVKVDLQSRSDEWTEEGKIVVGADGVDSLVARWAGINSSVPTEDLDAGYQYEMANINIEDPDMIHLYFGDETAPRGYAWIFPKGENRANVGIGIGGDKPKNAKYYLDKFIEEQGIDGSILEVNVGGIPVGGIVDDLVVDNVALVGDAARQVNPIHGGGMDEAFKSGELAGKKIAQAVNNDDLTLLEEYGEEWRERHGSRLEKILEVRRAAEKLDDEDINIIFETVKEEDYDREDLLKVSEGDYKPLFKTLMKNPNLLMRKNIMKTLKEAL